MHEGGRKDKLISLFKGVVLPLADAYSATSSSFHWSAHDKALVVADTRFSVDSLRHIYLVGAGKAGVPMSRSVIDTLQEDAGLWARFAGGTVNVYRDQSAASVPGVTFFAADHPNPNRASVEGAQAALDLISGAGTEDLVIAVLSGGGSSLLTLPGESISLEDFREANRTLVTGGATIQEINTVRKHLCRVKGGRLRLAAPAATFVTLVLSDVIGDDLSSIASGPTVPDSTTCGDAVNVLKLHGLWERIPECCRHHLLKGDPEEVRRAELWKEQLAQRTHNVIVASNAVVLWSLHEQLSSTDHSTIADEVHLDVQPVLGSVEESLERHLCLATSLSEADGRTTLLMSGGEPTVSIPPGVAGTGGRMLHYALMAAVRIAGRKWTVLASGTDGIDGTAPAAGAAVDGDTVRLARQHGLEPEHFLAAFDSYGFFEELEKRSGERFLNVTGPTGTNVNDIMLWLL